MVFPLKSVVERSNGYAHRYLAEAAWRFNRCFDLAVLVPRLLVAAATTKPWSERQLRNVPVYDS